MKRIALFALSLLLHPGVPVIAQEQPVSSRIEEINRTVELKTQELSSQREKQKSIEAAYNKIKNDVRGIQNQQAAIRKELDAVKQELESINKEIELSTDQIESLERRYASRIRALYMQRKEDLLESVFLVSDHTTLKKNAYFLSRIRSADQKIMDELLELKTARQAKIDELEKIIDQKEKIQDRITAQNKILSAKLDEQEKALKDFNRQQTELQQTIASLKAQALRIETVLTSITGAESSESRGQRPVKQGFRTSTDLKPYDGPGLEPVKGKIYVPVRYARLVGQNEEEISKLLGASGLLYSVEPGSDVMAVANGRIIYSGKMPGRGEIIIIDHGQRSYSLYGRLSSREVDVGQEVFKGDVIAETEDNEKSFFYFEIRKNGLAVNTKSYMKN